MKKAPASGAASREAPQWRTLACLSMGRVAGGTISFHIMASYKEKKWPRVIESALCVAAQAGCRAGVDRGAPVPGKFACGAATLSKQR
jgi:hypothetical protein